MVIGFHNPDKKTAISAIGIHLALPLPVESSLRWNSI